MKLNVLNSNLKKKYNFEFCCKWAPKIDTKNNFIQQNERQK